MDRRFLRFVLAGGFAAGVNVSSRYVFDMVMSYSLAIVVAYLLGMATAFTLTKLFVFEPSRRSVTAQFLRFTLVNVVAFLLVWGTSLSLADFAFPAIGMNWRPHDVAHVIGVAVPMVTSYFGHKHFSFGGNTDVES